MKCSTCDGERIAEISAKCSDMFSMSCDAEEVDDYCGYVPSDMNINDGGNYVEFKYCLDCGQMVGQWPVHLPGEVFDG